MTQMQAFHPQQLGLPERIDDPMSVARVFAASGLFKNSANLAAVASKIIIGRSIGLTDFEAMSGLHLFDGKVELASNLMAAKIKASGKYDYRADTTDKRCDITFFAVGKDGERKEIGKSWFTIDEAKVAGLMGKDNWKKFPRSMLFARAISAGYKQHCPDALGTAAPVYVEGEIDRDRDMVAEAMTIPLVRKASEMFDAQVVEVVEPDGTTHHAESAPAVDAESY